MESHNHDFSIRDLGNKTLARNNAQWETLKPDIFRMYIAEDKTLAAAMSAIEKTYRFKRS
jgi:Clr5 domain